MLSVTIRTATTAAAVAAAPHRSRTATAATACRHRSRTATAPRRASTAATACQRRSRTAAAPRSLSTAATACRHRARTAAAAAGPRRLRSASKLLALSRGRAPRRCHPRRRPVEVRPGDLRVAPGMALHATASHFHPHSLVAVTIGGRVLAVLAAPLRARSVCRDAVLSCALFAKAM